MDVSLCILAHNGHEEAARLIASIRAMRNLEVEIVIGQQSCSEKSLDWYIRNSDKMLTITDEELWSYGFGYSRQKLADAAESDWIISADCGEVWHDNPELSGIAATVDRHPECHAFRVGRGEPHIVDKVLSGEAPAAAIMDDNGRIFDRREMRWAGMIHEALFHRGTDEIWAVAARRMPPVCYVDHAGMSGDTEVFRTRKQVLYDHLIATIVRTPSLREGTDFYWYTGYWEAVVKPRYKHVTFEEWTKIGKPEVP
jgi:hypothetical protein